MSRTLDSQLSFADLELSRFGVHLDPVLQGIDAFLGQHSDLVEQVRLDLDVSGGEGGSHFGGPGGATPRMLDGGEWRQCGVVNKHSALRAGIFKA
jgi:hypothetical protein